MAEVPRDALVGVSRHLSAAAKLLGSQAGGAGVSIGRAQSHIEDLLEALPMGSAPAHATATEHLLAAHALAEEHLGSGGVEGEIRRLVGEALSRVLAKEEPENDG